MSNDHESFLKQLDAKRDALIVRLADGVLAAERNDLLTRVHEALRLAYARGYERARIEHGAEAARHAPPPTRCTCPACGRDIEIRPI